MKSIIKKILTMLFLITLNGSCALYAKVLVPKLELRTLRLNKDLTGFKYRYCTDRTFWKNKCKKGGWRTDIYLFKDKQLMATLKAMGFVMKVHRKPID